MPESYYWQNAHSPPVQDPADGDPADAASITTGRRNILDTVRSMLASHMVGQWRGGGGLAGTVAIYNCCEVPIDPSVVGSGKHYVIVGAAAGTQGTLIATPDGYKLQSVTNGKNFALNAVCYDKSNGYAIAVGSADGTDAYLLSTNVGPYTGWTERSNPKNVHLFGVASSLAGVTIAVGDFEAAADMYVIRSTNGTSWTELAILSGATGARLTDICWCEEPNVFCAVGYDASNVPTIYLIDPDGTLHATQPTLDITGSQLRSVAFNGRTVVAVGDGGDIQTSQVPASGVASASDLYTFTLVRNPSASGDDGNLLKVAADHWSRSGVFLATTDENYVLMSLDDGQTWSTVPHMPTVGDIHSATSWDIVCCGSQFFMARLNNAGSAYETARGGGTVGMGA